MAKKKETPPAEEIVASEDATTTEAATETVTSSEDTPQIEATQAEDSTESATAETQSETPSDDASTEAPAEATPSEETQPELSEALAPAEEAPVAERVEVAGGRNYETMFIVRSGEDNNAVTARIRSVVETDGGAIDNVRISEMRRLAYPIKKQNEGVYVVLNGRFTKETAEELDRALKLDEAVLRHMTLREDD